MFNPQKICDAIFRAAKSVGGRDYNKAQEITEKIVGYLSHLGYSNENVPTVENVQDAVEKVLIEAGHAKTAKAYIIYREQHKHIREFKSFVNSNEIMDGYISESDWRVKENSNMGYSLQGLNNHISSIVSSNYWLHKIYPQEVRDAHINCDFHLHDLQILASYCCGWDLQDLLIKGFSGVPGKVQSSAPKHLRAALGQITNFMYTMQGEAAGAQAFSSFDTFLAPFVKQDNLSYKEVKQALQEFLFNMNVPTRVGFQCPFTNLTMDLKCPKGLESKPVIIGGRPVKDVYGNFQKEMDMINRAFAELMMAGDSSGRIFTFPIPTYNITKDMDWDNPELDPLWEMTGKYGTPYFSNFVNSSMDPEDVRSMCCRLRLDNTKVARKGGVFGAHPLTGSIGVVTLNLARIGYLSSNQEEFIQRLTKLTDLAAESLEIKRKAIEQFTEQGLYPYSRHYLEGVKKATGTYWGNHFNTIGILGMNEACLNLLGVTIADPVGKKFAMDVMDVMLEKMEEYQRRSGDNYNLEATPAEGASYRLALNDKKQFPGIVTAGTNEPFYTNSTHLPVSYTNDVFEALKLQDELQCKYTGGTVLHGFLGERINDIEVVKKMVRKVTSNFKLPYFTLTPTFSVCADHGYISGEVHECKTCGRPTEVYSRVVGYYRPIQSWNKGKREEFGHRKAYDTNVSLASKHVANDEHSLLYY